MMRLLVGQLIWIAAVGPSRYFADNPPYFQFYVIWWLTIR